MFTKNNRGSALMFAIIIIFVMLVIVSSANYSSRMTLLTSKSLNVQDGPDNAIANQQQKNFFTQSNIIKKLINPNLFIGSNGFSSTNCIAIEDSIDKNKYCVILKDKVGLNTYEIMINTVKPILFDPKGFSPKGYFRYNLIQIVKKGNQILHKKSINYNTPPITAYEDGIFTLSDTSTNTKNLFALNIPLANPLRFKLFKDGDSVERIGGFVGILEVDDNFGTDPDKIKIYNKQGQLVNQITVPEGSSSNLPLQVKFGWYLDSKSLQWYMNILAYRVANSKTTDTSVDPWIFVMNNVTPPNQILQKPIEPIAIKNAPGDSIIDASFVTQQNYNYPLIVAITQPLENQNFLNIKQLDCVKNISETKVCESQDIGETDTTNTDFYITNIKSYIGELKLKTYSRYSNRNGKFYNDVVSFEFIDNKSLLMNIYSLYNTQNADIQQTNILSKLNLNNLNYTKNIINMYFLNEYDGFGMLLDENGYYNKYLSYSPNKGFNKGEIFLEQLGAKKYLGNALETTKSYILYNYYIAEKNNYMIYSYNLINNKLKPLSFSMKGYKNASFVYENNKFYIKSNVLSCILKRKVGSNCSILDVTKMLDLPIGVINSRFISI